MTAGTTKRSRALAAGLAVVVCLGFGDEARADQAVGLRAGTPGLGVELYLPLAPQLNLRLYGAGFRYDDHLGAAGLRYDRQQTLLNGGALLDWHPHGGRLRLTAGLVANGNEADLDARCSSGCTVGGLSVVPDPANPGEIDGHYDFGSGATYFGLGWVSASRFDTWFWTADAGVLLQDKPKAGLGAVGRFLDAESGEVVDAATLDAALSSEAAELEDALSDKDLYPVLSIGIGYRF